MSQWRLICWLLGGVAALLVGFSKTGVPGAAIPAVALMAEAFEAARSLDDAARLSVGAMLPVLLVGDAFAIFYYRRHADWPRLLRLFPFVAAGMAPGWFVLRLVPGPALRVLLGVLVLVLLVLHVAAQRTGWGGLVRRPWFGAAAGVLAGFGTTVGNAAGPVMGIYLVSRRLNKQAFLGTAAWFFLTVNLVKLPLFASLGMINGLTLSFDLCVAPLVAVGALLGAAAQRRIPQTAFNALVLALAAIAGLRLVLG